MKKIIFYFLLFIVFSSSLILSNETDSSDVIIFKVSEIPIQIDNTTAYLEEENNRIVTTSMVSISKKNLTSVNKRFEKLLEISDSVSLSNSNLVQLQNLQRRWNSLKEKALESLTTISERIHDLGQDSESLQNMLLNWEQTYKKYKSTDLPNELLISIKSINEKILSLIQVMENESNDLISIQIALSNKNTSIKYRINALDKAILFKQKAVFDRNSDPLWEQLADTTNSNSILKQASNLASSYSNYTISFYDYYKRKLASGILIFLLFLAFTFGLKYYGSKIVDDNPTIHKAILLFNKPFSISFLLFLLFQSYTSESSVAFQGLGRVLMLIPLLFILLKIIDSRLKSTLYIFMFLFFINELRVSSGNDNLLGSLILLGLAFLTLLAIYWVKKDNLISSFLHNDKIANLVNNSFNISFGLIMLVMLFDILGYVALSNILFNGFHNTIYATILFVTANLVFNAIVLIILKTKALQKLKIVLFHSPQIISTARNVIRISLSLAWIGILLNSFSIYDIVYDAIIKLLSINLGYGSISFSLSNILLFSITIWISFQLSKFIHFILEIDVLPQIELSRGIPGTITSITKYIILSIGLFMALVSIGIDFNKFALLFGALGVGIGFGLQSLVNNFLSGIILIFEHPIQIGDIIKVGDVAGTVKKIGIRASIVKSFDGSEIVVPNGNLISTELTNWTLSDKNRRIDVSVGVKYGSDVKKVEKLLLKCANDNKKILEEPSPIVLFQNFGNSSLDFTLRCWAENIDNWYLSQSELRFAINQIFEENDITIPFPQSDVYIKEFAKHEKHEKHEKQNPPKIDE